MIVHHVTTELFKVITLTTEVCIIPKIDRSLFIEYRLYNVLYTNLFGERLHCSLLQECWGRAASGITSFVIVYQEFCANMQLEAFLHNPDRSGLGVRPH